MTDDGPSPDDDDGGPSICIDCGAPAPHRRKRCAQCVAFLMAQVNGVWFAGENLARRSRPGDGRPT